MNSLIYQGQLTHVRREPITRTFGYPVYLYAIDLAELPRLDAGVTGFGHNRLRPVSLRDRDYLDPTHGDIPGKLSRHLQEAGISDAFAQIFLVTGARYFNYVFNPVSFFYCYASDGSLRCIVAEVNNTFWERHVYVLSDLSREEDTYTTRSRVAKLFHVSPFHDLQGEYVFQFADIRRRLDIRIDLIRDAETIFSARLTGEGRILTSAALWSTVARYPLTAALTMPRIVAQAAKLRFRHKLPIYEKPAPHDPGTYDHSPLSVSQWLGRFAFRRILGDAEQGSLEVQYPDGSRERFGSASGAPETHLRIRSNRFFSQILAGGAIGLGDAYATGNWESPGITDVLIFFIENLDAVDRRARILNALQKPLRRLPTLPRRITRARSRQNVVAHYDLGNEFFELFLDSSMMYSSGQYLTREDSLETAQQNKLRSILTKAGVRPNDHVLDIGCGWGGLATYAARQFGCRVTGITLSEQQLSHARARASRVGVSDRVEFELIDYRDVKGRFDKIVSVEMLEAVGAEDLPSFFSACDRLLAPDGRVVLQVITIADHRYENYARQGDWIQKEIFPGQTLSSRKVLTQAMQAATRFGITDEESLADDYARTLRDWGMRLEANWDEAGRLGYEESFLRKWRYYFAYCEAGFLKREVDDWQLVLTRIGGPDSVDDPGVRIVPPARLEQIV